MDQAHHFGTLGSAAAAAGSGSAGDDFREGLDGTERERKEVLSVNNQSTYIHLFSLYPRAG